MLSFEDLIKHLRHDRRREGDIFFRLLSSPHGRSFLSLSVCSVPSEIHQRRRLSSVSAARALSEYFAFLRNYREIPEASWPRPRDLSRDIYDSRIKLTRGKQFSRFLPSSGRIGFYSLLPAFLCYALMGLFANCIHPRIIRIRLAIRFVYAFRSHDNSRGARARL